jgi:enoyl-CoA hydratase
MDLKAFAGGEAGDIMGAKGGFGGIVQRDFPKPLIAAVNGFALAGGCEIMLACDLVVAVESAQFGIPEVKRGLMAAAGGLVRLPKRIPTAVAMELALTGDPIDARRAYELGLINRVVAAGALMDETLALAETVAANAPLAVRASKRVVKEGGELPDAAGFEVNDALVPSVFSSADAMEGAVAFAEKRPPRWTGT